MTDLIAFVLASLPVLAIVALVVETLRAGTSSVEQIQVDLLHRSYGA